MLFFYLNFFKYSFFFNWMRIFWIFMLLSVWIYFIRSFYWFLFFSSYRSGICFSLRWEYLFVVLYNTCNGHGVHCSLQLWFCFLFTFSLQILFQVNFSNTPFIEHWYFWVARIKLHLKKSIRNIEIQRFDLFQLLNM